MHKKHRTNYLNILLISDNESSPRSVRIHYYLLRAIFAGLAIFLVVLVLGVVTYGKVLQKALERNVLLEENKQLRGQVERVNQLSAELDKLKNYNEKIQNSLQGYVKFAQESNPNTENSPELFAYSNPPQSLFTDYPTRSPVVGFISQEYNWPVHNGIDIVAPEGTPITAAGDGMVIFTGWTVNDGFSIIILHAHGYLTYYKHNLRNLVFPLQEVRQGDVIALLGNSGDKSSGPHLHFEIWYRGKPLNPHEVLVDLKEN